MPLFAQPHRLSPVAAFSLVTTPWSALVVAVAAAPADKPSMVPIDCLQRRFSAPPVIAAKLYLPRVCLYRRLMKCRPLTASPLDQIPTMTPGKVLLRGAATFALPAAAAATRSLSRGYVQPEIPGPKAASLARVQFASPAAQAVPEMVMEAEI